MKEDKALVFCGTCGNTLKMGQFPIMGSIQIKECRPCIRRATKEGFNAGRMSAIMQFCEEAQNDKT